MFRLDMIELGKISLVDGEFECADVSCGVESSNAKGCDEFA